MDLQSLRGQLDAPSFLGTPASNIDASRSVIVQVFKGYNEEYDLPIYEYHEIKAVGVLFHRGEFKVVIAAGEEE